MSRWEYRRGSHPTPPGRCASESHQSVSTTRCATAILTQKTSCAGASSETDDKEKGTHLMAYEIQDENKSDAPTYNPVELFGEQVLDGVADLFNKMADEVEPHDAADLGDLYRFMVATTPYPVYVRAADSRAANEALHEHLSEFALAGFEAALEDDEVGLTIMPSTATIRITTSLTGRPTSSPSRSTAFRRVRLGVLWNKAGIAKEGVAKMRPLPSFARSPARKV